MPPKFLSDSGEHTVIRPLAFCKEEEIIAYANDRKFPIIPCNLCGSQPKMQRQLIKKMIKEWEIEHPDRSAVIFNALKNTHPSHLLDKKLFNFTSLSN